VDARRDGRANARHARVPPQPARRARRRDRRRDGYEHRSRKYRKMVRGVIEAQRAEILRLRNAGLISNEIMHRVERELDLEDERLET
jgi:CPA1 family monovalent cation:H+ antiporter